jgi:glycosyltransferase involved in cell wall biosynthesis
MKKNILFVGSFKKQGKDGTVGGQMFACNLLVNSDISDYVNWILIDTTAKTNQKRHFLTRLIPAFGRLTKSCYHMFFSKVDIVMVFASSGFSFLEKGLVIKIGRFLNKKTIIAPRSGFLIEDIKEIKGFKDKVRKILNKSDYIICQGTLWKEFFKNEFSLVDEKLEIINNWIAVDEYYPIKKTVNSPVRILFLGWVTKNKGIYDLVNAIKEIRDKNFIVEIAGNGDEFKNLESLLEKEGLSKKVHLLNWVYGEQKKLLLNRADIFVLPSYREGMPNSLIEAMASHTAIIATRVGGIPDLIRSKINGILVSPGDIDALKNAILYYLEDEERIIKFGERALEHVRENNSVDVAVEKFSKLFE